MKNIYNKHKEFITAIATLNLIPEQTNVHLIEIINAWKNHLIEIKSSVVVGDCAGCNGGWVSAVKDLYIYANTNKWNEVEKIIEQPKAEIKNEQPNKKNKRK